MNIYVVLLISLLVCTDGMAWSLECKYGLELDQSLNVSGSESLAIAAAAGDLEITGVADLESVSIRGRICVSEEEWLEEARVLTTPGSRAEISVVLPDTHEGWSMWRNRYAFVDLVLEVPDSLAVQLQDSSGDIEISNVASIIIRDSSGDIDLRGASGPVEIADSSGDIEVQGLTADFTIISDSSGDIRGRDIKGTARVMVDSSGDIQFSDIAGDVVVERDSSGDISAVRVGGDVRVLRDGSGDIYTNSVDGRVDIPEEKR